jgi:zinc protease
MKRNLIGTFFLSTILLCLPTAIFAQAKLVEKHTTTTGPYDIPYEKYVLPNGLVIVIHEDHSDPVVHVDVTYHVGSNREVPGISGFAHFFEHMMFQGSDHVGDEQHFKIVSAAGGQMNGTTNTDRTNYYETLPSNQLETALWLEADRMGFLLDAVTQKKFEVQRATVKNERGQNYDNRPYGLVNEKMNQALYPAGHPYSWPTIGYLEDLDRVNVDDLKRFFLRWYGPNNATLTVSGDVKPSEVLKFSEKYFGSIPKGPEVNALPKTPVTLASDRYISLEDNIKLPMLRIAYPTVPMHHADEPALDALADILGGTGNKRSPIYQQLVKNQTVYQGFSAHPTQELAGYFFFNFMVYPNKSLTSIETEIRRIIAEFEQFEITDQDIEMFKAKHEASMLNSLASVAGKGSVLASNQTFENNPGYLAKNMLAYNNLTKEDVKRVFKKYILNNHAVIISVVPKGKRDVVAQPDNHQIVLPPPMPPGNEYKNLAYTKPKDNFDRSKQPVAGEVPQIEVPKFYRKDLSNGLKIIGTYADEVPAVTMQLTIEGGHLWDPLDKAGMAAMMADLFKESTINSTPEQLSDRLGRLGSNIEVSCNATEIVFTVNSVVKNLDSTLSIFKEMLLEPLINQEDFDRIKNKQFQTINAQSNQAAVVANNAYNRLLYGSDNILGYPVIGTIKTLENIQVDDVRIFYSKYISPNVSSISVVGAIQEKDLLAKLAFLEEWKSRELTIPKELPVPSIEKTKLYVINKEKAPQSEIRIGYVAMPYDATGEYFKATAMNFSLGGTFNSRINLNLREDKGFTYGARSSFSGAKFKGPFTASAGVRASATDSSIVEFMKELKKFNQEGITKEELEYTRNAMGQSDALKYETPGQKVAFMKRILDYNLDRNFTSAQGKILDKITITEINELAKKHLPVDKMVIVVVGDKNSLYEPLLKLGYELVDTDVDGSLFRK